MPRRPKRPSPPNLILAAHEMRGEPTVAEGVLWEALRKKQLAHAKFRRQQVIRPYILDFYSEAHKLAIEVDGKGHDEPAQRQYDQERTECLNEAGIMVLRFTNDQVTKHLDNVIRDIVTTIEKRKRIR